MEIFYIILIIYNISTCTYNNYKYITLYHPFLVIGLSYTYFWFIFKIEQFDWFIVFKYESSLNSRFFYITSLYHCSKYKKFENTCAKETIARLKLHYIQFMPHCIVQAGNVSTLNRNVLREAQEKCGILHLYSICYFVIAY